MPGPAKDLKVFISSTSEDLRPYRAVARLAIEDIQWRAEMQETFPAQPGYTIDVCRRALECCDVVLLIVAWRQGWVPSLEQGGNGRDSITALEIAHADLKGIPVIYLFANDEWPGKFWELDEAKQQWVRDFRKNLNRVGQAFDYEKSDSLPAFRGLVRQAFLNYKEDLLARSASAAEANRSSVDPRIVDRARTELIGGTRTPVLGCGIYGDGPLSGPALVEALIQQDDFGKRETMPLATAAEYYERTLSRVEFLEQLSQIIRDQTAARQAVPPVLDFVGGLENIKTIVSATYDRVIEQRLEAAARPYVLITHVLRLIGENPDGPSVTDPLGLPAENKPEEGKVMVLRPGKPPEFYWADAVPLEESECVVYKLQGFPELVEIPGTCLMADTGVISESDYAVFLRDLGSKQKGVPASVITRLRSSPLLFLGYTMDLWQYRLMSLLFQSTRRQDRRTLAVRVPDNEMEKLAWGKLNAGLIEMDPNQFARRTAAARS